MSFETAPPTLSAWLRTATRESHERLEADLNSIWNQLDRPKYTQLLRRWYGFIKPWETAGTSVFSGESAEFFNARRKTDSLIADLKACGLTASEIEALPTCEPTALPFAEPSAALGVLYVIEGSTLGGQILSKQIQEKLGFSREAGGAYFSSYGPLVMPMWLETKRVLDAPPFAVEADRVVQSAVGTFDFLSGWLRG